METNDLLEQLRKRLTEYKRSEFYSNPHLRQDILSIEVAACLLEMAVYCKRPISEEEKFWFKGGYYISSDITGIWSDIASMYDQLVLTANGKGLL